MKSTAAPSNKNWVVYILRCRDNTFYTGATTNTEKRLIAHNKGTASRYTRARLPVALMAASRLMSQADALRLEIKIKKLPRSKKIAALAAEQIKEVRIKKDRILSYRRKPVSSISDKSTGFRIKSGMTKY